MTPNPSTFAGKLAKALQDSQQGLQESRDWSQNWTDLEPLITSIQQLRELLGDQSEKEGKAELGRQIDQKLTPALAVLQQANILIKQSNQADRKKRGELRGQAGDRLNKALALMQEVTEMSPPREE